MYTLYSFRNTVPLFKCIAERTNFRAKGDTLKIILKKLKGKEPVFAQIFQKG